MQFKPIKNEKTLTANEELIKEMLEQLLKLGVNLTKIKNTQQQRQMVAHLINALKNKHHTFTYKKLFDWLLLLMRTVKSKENIAMVSKLFTLVQTTYKQTLNNKNI